LIVQQIADTIGSEMNRLFQMFCSRNPTYHGAVSVAGHSLGTLLLLALYKPFSSYRSVVSANRVLIPVISASW